MEQHYKGRHGHRLGIQHNFIVSSYSCTEQIIITSALQFWEATMYTDSLVYIEKYYINAIRSL